MRMRWVLGSLCLALVAAAPARVAEPLPSTEPLRLAINDLIQSFGPRYPDGPKFLARLRQIEQQMTSAKPADLPRLRAELQSLQRDAMLANPLLNFDKLLLVRRNPARLGLPQNWEGNSSLPRQGYDNEIATLSPVRPDGTVSTLFKPPAGEFVGDVDLHFDAGRLLFSMPAANRRWQVFEVRADGSGLRQVKTIDQPDVDNYDACYLPDGDIIFGSTAPFIGVPCVTGASHVANLYRLNAAGQIRRLTFDQEHNWCPTVLNNGRLLYLRWEYSDLPHFVARILFHMNPDGTEQIEYYGSNSYWPNAMFYARPVPGHPTKFVAIIGGHHGVPRMGELVLFDAARGRREADGAIQRIPGRNQPVQPIILDQLVDRSWPKYLHPFPLSEKYFLVSAKPTPTSDWGIYLVDVFDNITLLKELKGQALLEPLPLRKTTPPPVVPSKVNPERKDALVYLADVYAGKGLDGIPRGAVKRLRVFTYHFAYHGMGGQVNRVGLDGPWDIKRVLGTVPVEEDGSALFTVPANTPIAVQPLDSEGKALQLMRSWFTAMPGENVSCVGCHEHPNSAPPVRDALALRRAPSQITPWYGPTRGFSFIREVQPVLDQHCVSCHNGGTAATSALPDLRTAPPLRTGAAKANYDNGTHFTPSYLALKRYVRNPTIESDMHLLTAMDYHADTTALVQLLSRGHHGVKLDAEAWDRLITWIDLNTPAHGTWHEIVGDRKVTNQRDRRRAMLAQYAGIDEDPEAILAPATRPTVAPVRPTATLSTASAGASTPQLLAVAPNHPPSPIALQKQVIALSPTVRLDLVRIPSGEFVMGSSDMPDESPAAAVRIRRDFWIGATEITNEQYALFDPAHDSRLESGDFLHFSEAQRGFPLNEPRQPVVRISWREATAFCQWLSQKTGRKCMLPTEAQWEYACRAGTTSSLSYGGLDADFAPFANLADITLYRTNTFAQVLPPWRLAITTVDDKFRVAAPVASFKPNPWGLYDMHGNAAEWTRTAERPYPYADDGRDDPTLSEKRVVRGGSWYDRPAQARSSDRLAYRPYQRVFNVGFRVIVEE